MPVDSAPRFLAPLLGKRAEWRAAQRMLLIGNVTVPRVTVRTSVSGNTVRVALEASEKVPFRVAQEQGRVTVAIPRDVIDVSLQPERFTGGIVDGVQFVGGKDNVFTITLGRRFKELQAHEEEAPAAPRPRVPGHAAGRRRSPARSPRAAGRSPRSSPAGPAVRTVVIDPGHGGDDVGAKGPGGRAGEGRHARHRAQGARGRRRTRSACRPSSPATRTRTWPSTSAPPSPTTTSPTCSSPSTPTPAAPRGRGGARCTSCPTRPATTRAGAWPRWRAERSRPPPARPPARTWPSSCGTWRRPSTSRSPPSLASRIQEELAEVTGNEGRGVKQAPFRVLVGAAMPAVLVEVAFISNSEEEKLLTSDAYQSRIAAAVVRGIARFQQRPDAAGGRARHASRPAPARSPELRLPVSLAAQPRHRPHRAGARRSCCCWWAWPRRAGRASSPAPCPRTRPRTRRGRPREEEPAAVVERTINVKLFFQGTDQPGPGDGGAHRALLQRPRRASSRRWWRS